MALIFQAARDAAAKVDAGLSCGEFDPNSLVIVEHCDGSILTFRGAFLQLYFDPESRYEFVIVFTEHTGFHVFRLDELRDWRAYKLAKHRLHADHPGYNFICDECFHTYPVHFDTCPNENCCVGARLRPMTDEEKATAASEIE